MNWDGREKTLLAMLGAVALAVVQFAADYSRWPLYSKLIVPSGRALVLLHATAPPKSGSNMQTASRAVGPVPVKDVPFGTVLLVRLKSRFLWSSRYE